jgi:hypothetical protein
MLDQPYFKCVCGKTINVSRSRRQRVICHGCSTGFYIEGDKAFPLGAPLRIEGRQD